MKKKITIILFFFLLYTQISINGQDINNHIISPSLRNYGLITRNWNTNNGLPSDLVYDFIKNQKGFLWITTNQGLVRFDGSEFKAFDDQQIKVLRTGLYSDLVSDNKNNIYFINENRVIKKNKADIFSNITDGFPDSELLSGIVIDTSGNLWIGTVANGLFKFIKNKLVAIDSADGLNSKYISTLTVDKNNNLWVGTVGEGIFKYDNGKFDNVISSRMLPSKHIKSFFVDSFNRFWVGTNQGVLLFKRTNNTAELTSELITTKIVSTISEDSDHNIWMGSIKNGILIYNEDKLLNFTTLNNLPDNNITKIAIYGDNIWVGTVKGGLVQIRKSQIFSIGKKEGLLDDYTNSVYEDKDGSILIGTTNGLYRIDSPFSRRRAEKLRFLNNKHIFAIKRNEQGDLLIGTRFNGLYILKKNSRRNYNSVNGLKVNFIRCIFVDDDGSIWAGTNNGGISILKNGNIRNITKNDGLSNNLIAFIHKSISGNYWIGTSGGGVNIIDKKGNIKIIDKTNGLTGNIISSIYEERNGNMWLTINGGGVALIKDDKITTFTTANGLYTDVVINVVCDKDNTFWFSTPKGIFSVKKSSFLEYMSGKLNQIKYRYFDKSDGMIANRCVGSSQQSSTITRDNTALFSTTNGLVEIKPSMIREKNEKVKLYLDKVVVNNKSVNKDVIKDIAPNPERIEFSFGAINFQDPDKSNFKCKLSGVDKNWIELGKNKSIGYSHLPYGSYKFKLIGYDPGNNIEMGSTEIAFFIEPYFWETIYFRIFFSLFVIILLVLITRFINKRKYEQQIKDLEAEKALEKERMRISTDMHDEFGASLSKISLLSEIAKNNISNQTKIENLVNEISDSGRTLAASMDEIVWAVNPKNDRLDKMLYYISNYFENHLALTDISFRVKIPEEIPGIFISAEVRHNIFSVIKEGINNSLKHSRASIIELIFNYAGNELSILLKDNGCGIDFSKIKEFSNGLSNMEKRINSIGGNIEIKKGSENGTEIRIIIKI